MQKVNGNLIKVSNACIYLILGSISLPFLGSYHHSFTVLDSLSVIDLYLDLEGGPPIFKQVLPVPF